MIRRYLFLIVLATFLVGFFLLLFFVFVKTPASFKSTWVAFTLPEELRQAKILSQSEGEDKIFTAKKFSYQWTPYSVVPLLRQESSFVEPSQAPSTGLFIFSQPVKNPEGNQFEDKIPSNLARVNPAQSEVLLFFPKDGSTKYVISGYAPIFLDDTHFLFFASNGLYRYDLQSGNAERLLDQAFPVVTGSVVQSPDRKLFAFYDTTAKATVVYRVEESGLKLVLTVNELIMTPALSNDTLYDLKGKPTGSEVWKYSLDGKSPAHVYTFPFEMSFTRILF